MTILAAAAWSQQTGTNFEGLRHIAHGMKKMTKAATKIQLYIIRRVHRARKIKYLVAGLGFRFAMGLIARGVLLARRHSAANALKYFFTHLREEVPVDVRSVLHRFLFS